MCKGNKTEFEILENAYSVPRMRTYKILCQQIRTNNFQSTQECRVKGHQCCADLYWKNQYITIFIFTLISHFEILLRNKVQNIIVENFAFLKQASNGEWVLDDKFTRDGLNNSTTDRQGRTKSFIIKQLEHELFSIYKDLKVSQGRNPHKPTKEEMIDLIISRLAFGVYTAFVETFLLNDNKLISSSAKKILNANILAGGDTRKINGILRNIRNLRNRCAHHESIIKSIQPLQTNFGDIIDFSLKIGGQDYYNVIQNRICTSYNKRSFEDVFKQLKPYSVN